MIAVGAAAAVVVVRRTIRTNAVKDGEDEAYGREIRMGKESAKITGKIRRTDTGRKGNRGGTRDN